ncbi:hypothetical protein T12_179 [Trichinella patagoniensis]|uniref:Uncharacterized protein n=1 Tax=Trichinella patagoniensis TaxID=990121 RepID=A0A0V1AFG6_9BILA|nr:hypothetical protein T12_179 [Trichinella patagoniensis]
MYSSYIILGNDCGVKTENIIRPDEYYSIIFNASVYGYGSTQVLNSTSQAKDRKITSHQVIEDFAEDSKKRQENPEAQPGRTTLIEKSDPREYTVYGEV